MKLITKLCTLYLLLSAATSTLPGQGLAVDCEKWGTIAFWQTAILESVVDCLKAGADPNTQNEDGDTPLHTAARFNDNRAVISALVEAGFDPNTLAENNYTPLHTSARSNDNPSVITALVEARAVPKSKDEDGKSPWDYAKDNEDPRVPMPIGA